MNLIVSDCSLATLLNKIAQNNMQELENLCQRLSHTHAEILRSVWRHAMNLLDHTPRFQYYTLHGSQHHCNLFRNLEILLRGQIDLPEYELFILSVAICVHDLGMVLPMKEYNFQQVVEGRPGVLDPARFEDFVRDVHHEMVRNYVSLEFSFLANLGVQIPDLAIISDVAKAHRKVKLHDQRDIVKRLGALMRLVDELDIGPTRAPIPNFLQRQGEMDDISLFHWYKHIITESWTVDNNVHYQNFNGRKEISFSPVVHPNTSRSIPYWLTQVMRPIRKALDDEQCQKIIYEAYGVKVTVKKDQQLSSSLFLGNEWTLIEDKVLGAGRHTILVVDDEIKRIDDLFLPLMEKYYVHCVPRVKSALEQLEAKPVDLLIVDMQMTADGIWSAMETEDFRFTGMKIAEFVKDKYPATKIMGLTGIKYALPNDTAKLFECVLRKPIDPLDLLGEVNNFFQNNR